MSKKTGLQTGAQVNKNHFSFNKSRDIKSFSNSRLVIRILDGSHLLASDLDTGKSDPMCFVWYGPNKDKPEIDYLTRRDQDDSRVLCTSVCPTTIDPIWNEELVFPIDIQTIKLVDLMNFYCYIYVCDYDASEIDPVTIEKSVSYDSLGELSIQFQDIIKNGKLVNNNAFMMGMKPYQLQKLSHMRREDLGSIKLSISIIFGDDAESLFPQISPDLKILKLPDFLISLGKHTRGELQVSQNVSLNTSRSQNTVASKMSTKSLNNAKTASLAKFPINISSSPHLISSLPTLFKLKPLPPVKENTDTLQSTDYFDESFIEDSLFMSPMRLPSGEGLILEPLMDIGRLIESADTPSRFIDDYSDEFIPSDMGGDEGGQAPYEEELPKTQSRFRSLLSRGNKKLIGATTEEGVFNVTDDEEKTLAIPMQPMKTLADALIRDADLMQERVSFEDAPPLYTGAHNVAVIPAPSPLGDAASTMKELSAQRDLLQRSLSEIAKMTKQGLSGLAIKLDNLEKSISTGALTLKKDVGITEETVLSALKSASKNKRSTLGLRKLISQRQNNDVLKEPSDIILFKEKQILRDIKILKIEENDADEIIPEPCFDEATPYDDADDAVLSSKIKGLETPELLTKVTPAYSPKTHYRTTPGRIEGIPFQSLVSAHNGANTLNGVSDSSQSPVRADNNEEISLIGYHSISWNKVTSLIEDQDWFSVFCYVLDRGVTDDVYRLMTIVGPKPEVLSTFILNRLFDVISSMLQRNLHTEQCLIWILALNRRNISGELLIDTKVKLVNALSTVASKATKRGLLAALLASKLSRTMLIQI